MGLPSHIVAASNNKNESKDCAIKAIAIATGTDYDIVHALCTKHGRSKGRGTMLWIMEAVLTDLGWKFNKEAKWEGKTATSLKLPFAGRFLAFTSSYRHVFAVRGGLVKDWTEGTKYRIHAVWEIEAK